MSFDWITMKLILDKLRTSLQRSIACQRMTNDTVSKLENKVKEINNQTNYQTVSTPTGSLWTDNKPIWRKVVDLGSLPSSSSSVAHGISDLDNVVSLSGIARDGSTYLPLPFVEQSAGGTIHLSISGDNVELYVASHVSYTSYTGVAIIEYTRAGS